MKKHEAIALGVWIGFLLVVLGLTLYITG